MRAKTEIRHQLILHCNNPVGYIKGNLAIADNIFKKNQLEQWLTEQKYDVKWQDGIFEKLIISRRYYEFPDVGSLKDVRIWQLKSEVNAAAKFLSLDEMISKHGQPIKADYEAVFDGDLCTSELEDIYNICHNQSPGDYRGHALAKSDIVELYDETSSSFYYLDQFGFKEISFKEEFDV